MIGLLGGTFDPIHYGHLRVALEILEKLGLDEIRFLPCGLPPHRVAPVAAPDVRADLVALAIAGTAGFVLDRQELKRKGPSYTYDTLVSLRDTLGMQPPLCLILGSDAFSGLPDWHCPEALLDLVHVVVAQRPGEPVSLPPRLARLVQHRMTEEVADLRAVAGGHVIRVGVTQLDISATAIRGLLQKGGNPRFLMPDNVIDAIREQGLYGQKP